MNNSRHSASGNIPTMLGKRPVLRFAPRVLTDGICLVKERFRFSPVFEIVFEAAAWSSSDKLTLRFTSNLPERQQ